MTETRNELQAILEENIMGLEQIVFSKPCDAQVLRSRAKPVLVKGERVFALETFGAQNKVSHKNVPISEAPGLFARLATEEYRQTNIITPSGECSVMISKKGKITLLNKIKRTGEGAILADASQHDRKKNYIIDSTEHTAFLHGLGVCDEKGRVFDKKRAKYRQINRFVELLDDVYASLPPDKVLTVCDLCCGKSYLTFAVYYYLTALKSRRVVMYGVDLKADVIEYCSRMASSLGCEGLSFICGDIMEFETEERPDLVISLHACDIATDIVLAYAVRKNAGMILSTPCCHHEMFHTMKSSELGYIERHSILKQKFCDAATDALRALRLEAEGYKVEAIELIDPEETPKNVMIRAIKSAKIMPGKRENAMKQYNEACVALGVQPMLDKLLDK